MRPLSPGHAGGAKEFDIVVVGGALAGAGTARLLLDHNPCLRVLVVEKSERFTRRVGEATVEISAWWLTRALGLMQYLNEAHLVKQGMRFWFTNDRVRALDEASEIGGSYLTRVPAFQVDRATLDEEVLRRACESGAQVLRPASVVGVELQPGGMQTVILRHADGEKRVRARWVVDASGVAAIVARQKGWHRPNEDHPVASAWARWRGVKDWDGLELARKFPAWSAACHGIRATATNHLVGHGWWAWFIPLKGGDVSVGVVFDRRIVDWPEEGSVGERLKEFLCRHPVGREILGDATWMEGDVHWRKHLPYCSKVFAGDGFVLVGDASAFLDPFYSPGMDWVAFTTTSAVELIAAQRRGESVAPLIDRHNRQFAQSYQRWFDAVYRDKYEFLGEFDLMRLAFLLDLGMYYLGVASQPFKRGIQALREPVFTTRPSVPFYWLMRTYTRRFVAMARSRRARGVWGRNNAGQRFLFGGYTFSPTSAVHVLKALAGWGRLEITEGWRTWFSRRPVTRWPARRPISAAAWR